MTGETLPSGVDSRIVLIVDPSIEEERRYSAAVRGAGLSPLSVSNPSAALRCASDVDLIVAADELPGPIDGFDFVQRLRRHDETRPKPVIVLTRAAAGSTHRRRAETAGCDVVLVKPCLPEALISEIERLITRSRSMRERSDNILARTRSLVSRSQVLCATAESLLVGYARTRSSDAQGVHATENRRIGADDRRTVRRGGRRLDDEGKAWWTA